MKNTLTLLRCLMLSILVITVVGCHNSGDVRRHPAKINNTMIQVTKSSFGSLDGKEIYLFEISNPGKMIVRITNYGGIVTSMIVPDRNGNLEDVVLGFDNLQSYLDGHPYFGCLAGRYANRIAGGKFSIDGKDYQLAVNNGENHLHGGLKGLDKVVWEASEYRNGEEAGIELTYLSPDGEEGYPGNLKIRVICSMLPDRAFKLDYFAETDRATPVNLTHHGYFNLKGEGDGDIMDLILQIHSDRYTVINENLIPTGELRDVTGTPFDFRKGKAIGMDFSRVEGGYDHNFVLNNDGKLAVVASVRDPGSGRVMEVLTTEPGMQFYAGNFLDGSLVGKSGKAYRQHYALCLETQHFPDSPNQPSFPDAILRPGSVYRHTTIYRFSAE